MVTTHKKVLLKIPQIKNEKDWLFVKHALKASDQWGHETGNVSTESADYENKKQKVFNTVLQCIGQKYMPMVMTCKIPKELWDTLCQFFERKTFSNQIYILMQLYGLRMKRGVKMHNHLCQLDKLSDQLPAIREEVSEVHEVAVLLKSL